MKPDAIISDRELKMVVLAEEPSLVPGELV